MLASIFKKKKGAGLSALIYKIKWRVAAPGSLKPLSYLPFYWKIQKDFGIQRFGTFSDIRKYTLLPTSR